MKQYGDYSDADLNDWQKLPMVSSVLTTSAFGAWLMRRDERKGEIERTAAHIEGFEDFRRAVFKELEKWDWQELYLPAHFKELVDSISIGNEENKTTPQK